jgi:radical SAM protein with 4Fe4S-binding SPASM domain
MPDAFEGPLQTAVLELTCACNLACPHCASRGGKARQGELSTQEWIVVIEALVALGCEKVTLLGGEVFLRDDWLALVDEPLRHELLGLPLERLGISLDGADRAGYRATRGVDGFDRVLGLVRHVRDAGKFPVTVITTFSQLNVHQLDGFIALLAPEKVTWQVQFASTSSPGLDRRLLVSTEQYELVCRRVAGVMLEAPRANWIATMDDMGYFPVDPLLRLLHLHWEGCPAGIRVAGVRSSGDVLGCLSLGDAFVEANVRERPLEQIWRSPQSFVAFRGKRAPMLRGACARCPKAVKCLAGCAAMAVSSTGSMYENRHCLRRIETERIVGALVG